MSENQSIPYTNRLGEPDFLDIVSTSRGKGGVGMSRIFRRSDSMQLCSGGVERAEQLIEKGKV